LKEWTAAAKLTAGGPCLAIEIVAPEKAANFADETLNKMRNVPMHPREELT
jgi:hypothetical protein